MNTDSFRQTYALDGAGIDRLSEEIDSRLETIRLERENRLRIRLSMEEALLRMRDHFGEEKQVTLTIAERWANVRPVFLKTLRKGSLDASFALSEKVCVQKLGIEKHFVTVGLPHGLVLFMPISALGTLVFTMYTASVYHLEVSPSWYLMVLVLATLLFVATPPVPGANLLAYAALFVQFGFPSIALIDAMIFDIIFGIFAAAANQLLLEMDLTLQASRIGLLDGRMQKK